MYVALACRSGMRYAEKRVLKREVNTGRCDKQEVNC